VTAIMLDRELLATELAKLGELCREDNWDGFNAAPVSELTLRKAQAFIEGLPDSMPRPSLGAEPDGYVTFEWHRDATHTLAVSVGSSQSIYYAWICGYSRIYGRLPPGVALTDEIITLARFPAWRTGFSFAC